MSFKLYVDLLGVAGFFPKRSQAVHKPQRALVINLSGHLGDIVMQLPFLERLHSENPELILHAAVAKPMGALLREIAFLRHVHEIDFGKPRRRMLGNYSRIWTIVQYFIESRSEFSVDMCLLPRWGVDPFGSAYLAYLTGAPTRIGNDPRAEFWNRETFPSTRLLLTEVPMVGHEHPEAIRELRLLEACGLTHDHIIDPQEESKRPIGALREIAGRMDAALTDFGLSEQRRFCVIAPGASAPSRRWPAESFARVAKSLGKSYQMEFAAVGSTAEIELGKSLERL